MVLLCLSFNSCASKDVIFKTKYVCEYQEVYTKPKAFFRVKNEDVGVAKAFIKANNKAFENYKKQVQAHNKACKDIQKKE